MIMFVLSSFFTKTLCKSFLFTPVFDVIERYAPGFKDSVIGRDILTPPDLEKTFGLTGGVSLNLFSEIC